LNFEQFDEKVSENMSDLILNGLKDLMKQMKAHETSFKQPQNEIRLSPKPTPKSKRDRTRV
jgi:hypothetical protein